jgi:hypothetical protein
VFAIGSILKLITGSRFGKRVLTIWLLKRKLTKGGKKIIEMLQIKADMGRILIITFLRFHKEKVTCKSSGPVVLFSVEEKYLVGVEKKP